MSQVDVIIPCYKYARFLQSCVQSVLSQEGVAVRALVIDDCSPDNTAEVANELACQDKRIEFRRHASNQGHIATYNEGIEWLRGDYALLLSADDMLTPGALLRATRLMDKYPEVGLTYGRAIRTNKLVPSPCTIPANYEQRIVSGTDFIASICAGGFNIVPTPTVIVRGPLQKKLGGYRQELPHAGDLEMWLRFAAHSDVGVMDVDQAYYRVHGENMTRLSPGIRDLDQRRLAFEVLFNEYGCRIINAPRLRQRVKRCLAEQAFWAASDAFDRADKAQCRECLQLAVDIDRRLRVWPGWWRLGIKRLMGPALWSHLRPWATRLRGRPLPATDRVG